MIKHVVVAALAAAALAGPAPAAQADRSVYDCSFNSVQQEDVTGPGVYEGAIWGYLVHAGDDTARIRCFVEVNGVEVDGTDTTAGTAGVSVVAGRLTFTANDTDWVRMCGEVTTSHGTLVDCFETTGPWFPPQEVWDVLNEALRALGPAFAAVDATFCPLAGDLSRQGAGVPGYVTIEEGGDVYVAGELFWDCPPFETQG